MKEIVKSTRAWFERRNQAWLEADDLADLHTESGIQPAVQEMLRRRAMHERRGARERKIISDVDVEVLPLSPEDEGFARVRVYEHTRFLYEIRDHVEHEQREMVHELLWRRGRKPVLQMHDHIREISDDHLYTTDADARSFVLTQQEADAHYRGAYNRTLAYRYAEQWWNSHNPQYQYMGVDCTNFVSQVMHAGGLPMVGGGRRDAGWWYRSGQAPTWSYSWAVAHSLATFLSSPQNPFRARVVQSPQELTIGDVIAYDWTHSGRYGHNTVVVGHDANGMPLVNAHTVDSHQRFYSYEDSYAYTPNTQYLFIHFLD
ncbi:MAG: amidase domain-containing protein [Firmicutes bacterium]|nr:amidase domain-containing protein [Bacillota bacterium]